MSLEAVALCMGLLVDRVEAAVGSASLLHPSLRFWSAAMPEWRSCPALAGAVSVEVVSDPVGAAVMARGRFAGGGVAPVRSGVECAACGGDGKCGRCGGSGVCGECSGVDLGRRGVDGLAIDGVGCVACEGSGSCVGCGSSPGECPACSGGVSAEAPGGRRGRVSGWSAASRRRFAWELSCLSAAVAAEPIAHVPISCGAEPLDAREFKAALDRLQRRFGRKWPGVFGLYVMEDQRRLAWHAHWFLAGFGSVERRAVVAGEYVRFEPGADVFALARESGDWWLQRRADGRSVVRCDEGALVAGRDRDSGRRFLFRPGYLQRSVVECFGLNGSPLEARLAYGARPSFHDSSDPGRDPDSDSRAKLRSYLLGDLAGAKKAQRRNRRPSGEFIGNQWGRINSAAVAEAVRRAPKSSVAIDDLMDWLARIDAMTRPVLRSGVHPGSVRSECRDLAAGVLAAEPQDRWAALMAYRDALGAGVGESGPERLYRLAFESGGPVEVESVEGPSSTRALVSREVAKGQADVGAGGLGRRF